MDSQQPNPNPEMEELLHQAAERVNAGEPIDLVINAYPSQIQPELSALLDVAFVARQTRLAPIPPRDPAVRARGKANFMQAIAVEKARHAALIEAEVARLEAIAPRGSAAIVEPPSLETGQHQPGQGTGGNPTLRSSSARPTLWQQFQALIASLVNPTAMRLAPIALALLMLVVISGSGLVVASRAAIPGDLTYPIKQWLRQQAVILAPDDMRQGVLERQAEEQALEVEAAALRQLEEEKPQIIDATAEGILFGEVLPTKIAVGYTAYETSYFPNRDALERQPMDVDGELAPGSRVKIWYQIVPPQLFAQDGQTTPAGEPILQIKVIKVLAPPPTPTPTPTITPTVQPVEGAAPVVEETPTPSPTPVPTATGLSQAACRVNQVGWVGYRIQAGDTLSGLAARVGVSTAKLRTVNCLPGPQINAGSILYVPALPATATPLPTRTPTNTATSTVTHTPTSTLTSTPTSTPTAEATETPIPTPTAADELFATATALPTKTPSPVSTASATASPATTATGTATATTGATPSATLTATPGATSTSEVTATPTLTPTPIPTATATATVTATQPSATPTSPGATATAIPTAIPTATSAATSAATSTATPAATSTALPEATGTSAPSSTPTNTNTVAPSATATALPAATPTNLPTATPSTAPTALPPTPTPPPTLVPTKAASTQTATPTLTPIPTLTPTAAPPTDTPLPPTATPMPPTQTPVPTTAPTTIAPTVAPTTAPTLAPTLTPTPQP